MDRTGVVTLSETELTASNTTAVKVPQMTEAESVKQAVSDAEKKFGGAAQTLANQETELSSKSNAAAITRRAFRRLKHKVQGMPRGKDHAEATKELAALEMKQELANAQVKTASEKVEQQKPALKAIVKGAQAAAESNKDSAEHKQEELELDLSIEKDAEKENEQTMKKEVQKMKDVIKVPNTVVDEGGVSIGVL